MSAALGKYGSVRSDMSSEEWEARCDLAACYRLVDLYGWGDFFGTHCKEKFARQWDAMLRKLEREKGAGWRH